MAWLLAPCSYHTHCRADPKLDRHQRMMELLTAALGRPRTVYVTLSLVAGWIALGGSHSALQIVRHTRPILRNSSSKGRRPTMSKTADSATIDGQSGSRPTMKSNRADPIAYRAPMGRAVADNLRRSIHDDTAQGPPIRMTSITTAAPGAQSGTGAHTSGPACAGR